MVSYTGGVLSYSRGSSSVVFSASSDTPRLINRPQLSEKKIIASVPRFDPRKKRQTSGPNTFNSGTDLNEFKGSGSYTLTKVSCRAVGGKSKRSVIEKLAKDVDKNFISDSLRAKINYSEFGYKYLHFLQACSKASCCLCVQPKLICIK